MMGKGSWVIVVTGVLLAGAGGAGNRCSVASPLVESSQVFITTLMELWGPLIRGGRNE